MLNYDELRILFTKRLAEFDEARLLAWIQFDQRRQLAQLLEGETVSLSFSMIEVNKVSHGCETILSDDNNDFATAA